MLLNASDFYENVCQKVYSRWFCYKKTAVCRANKCKQIFLQTYLKGSRQMLWYLYVNLSMHDEIAEVRGGAPPPPPAPPPVGWGGVVFGGGGGG